MPIRALRRARGARHTSDAGDAARGVDFSDDAFRHRFAAQVGSDVANQPARSFDAIGRRGVQLGAIGGAAYAGPSLYRTHQDRQESQRQEDMWSDYMSQRQDILDNPNLSPEERAELLAELDEQYQEGLSGGENAIEAWLSGLGMVEKAFLALLIILIIRQAARAWS